MDFRNCYISSNCNQTPTAADCNNKNIIAYGSCNAVLIYDPKSGSGGKIIYTLVGHTKRVNTVRWIKGFSADCNQELVSGGTDGRVVVWTLKNGKYDSENLIDPEFENIISANIVDGYSKDVYTIICSAAMNEYSLRIWYREPLKEFQLQQRILFGHLNNPTYCVGLRIGLLNETNDLIVACGLDNSKIHLLTQNSENNWHTSGVISDHEDWIRGLDFCADGSGDLILASASQDFSVRLWRITPVSGAKELKVSLESLLTGHEGWVYSVHWNPKCMQLLSASIDKSMIIWEFDTDSALWLEKIRVGEVGGNTLGFYGGFFNATGDQIIAYSYHGAFHIWTRNENNLWDPTVTVGGHFADVVDICWEPQGEFLYSASADQTTRIHAPWRKSDQEITWHEIARPQVHGYDLSSIGVISRYKYAAGAEEKVIRVFEAPETYVKNLKNICNLDEETNDELVFIPKGASVPSLGLSNKAVYTEDNIEDTVSLDNKNPYPEESHFVAQILSAPPTEETLVQNTLWPEIQKLYGHGYEIFSLATSPDGKYLASACKSTKPQHAAIFLWDTSDWKHVQTLMSHNLTVVQMKFSPDSESLISVSRDRRWSLFRKNSDEMYELIGTTNKETAVHSRIIWTCGWTHDSKYFATGSREGKLVLWTRNLDTEFISPLGQVRKAADHLEFENVSVTAVAFGPGFVNESYVTSVGLEKGTIEIFLIKNLKFQKIISLSTEVAHHLAVRKLAFRPKFGEAGCKDDNTKLQLASCSSDTSVRIYTITL